MKKKFLIIGIVIIFLIVSGISYFTIMEIRKENELINEINRIVELSEEEDIDIYEINNLLDRVVTKGEYQKVEKAAKNYMRDSIDNIMIIYNVISDDDLINVLSIENIKKDGPNFNETRKYITDTKETLNSSLDKYYEYFTEEVIMSYFDTENTEEKYVELYKDVIGDFEIESIDTTFEDAVNDIIELLNIEEKVLDFLTKNKNYWTTEGENIVFDNDKLLEEYNSLIVEMSNI